MELSDNLEQLGIRELEIYRQELQAYIESLQRHQRLVGDILAQKRVQAAKDKKWQTMFQSPPAAEQI